MSRAMQLYHIDFLLRVQQRAFYQIIFLGVTQWREALLHDAILAFQLQVGWTGKDEGELVANFISVETVELRFKFVAESFLLLDQDLGYFAIGVEGAHTFLEFFLLVLELFIQFLDLFILSLNNQLELSLPMPHNI